MSTVHTAFVFLPATAAPTAEGSPYPLIILILLACWVTLAVSLVVAWPRLRDSVFPAGERRIALLGLAVSFLVGLALRLWLSPRVPMLSTYTGLEHIAGAFSIARLEWAQEFQSAYPLAVPALAGALMMRMGESAAVFQYAVCGLSLLALPGVYVLGRKLWGRPAEGLLAAAFLAVFPPLLTFSTSGSLALPYAALGTLSLALLALWLETGARSVLVALLAALVLTLQARLEAALFILPVAAALVRFTRADLPAARARFPNAWNVGAVLLFSAAALPYLVTKLSQLAAGTLTRHPPAWHGMASLIWPVLVIVGLCYLWGRHYEKNGWRPMSWASVVAVVAWFFVLERWLGLEVFLAEPVAFAGNGFAHTWAPVGFLYLNPKLVPVSFTLAWFAALATLHHRRDRRNWLFLTLWFVAMYAVSTLKATGELPFAGVRTALVAAPPFLLLAARGVTWAVGYARRTLRARWQVGLAAGVAAALGVLSFIPPLQGACACEYNQQEEFRFALEWMPSLPDEATVLIANDAAAAEMSDLRIADLFRTRAMLAVAAHQAGRTIQVKGIHDPTGFDPTSEPGPLYFYDGLDCYRTGTTARRRTCDELRALPNLRPVARRSVANRMYNGDYFDRVAIIVPAVELAVYRVGRTPATPTPPSSAPAAAATRAR